MEVDDREKLADEIDYKKAYEDAQKELKYLHSTVRTLKNIIDGYDEMFTNMEKNYKRRAARALQRRRILKFATVILAAFAAAAVCNLLLRLL